MKTALKVAAVGVVIILFSYWLNRNDDTSGQIMANQSVITKIFKQKDAAMRAEINGLKVRYNADVLETMATESRLLTEIDRIRKIPVVANNGTTQLSSNPLQLPWSPDYPVFLTAVENYIAENISIRSKMAEMITSYEDIIKLKDEAYGELFQNFETLGKVKVDRWGFTIGVQAGVSPSGSFYVGFGGTWGIRL